LIHSAASSTPQLSDSLAASLEYSIARSSRATAATPIHQAVAALNGRRDRLPASSRRRDGTGSPARD
jgi:hypothetical protein